jgi:hypothetical protein
MVFVTVEGCVLTAMGIKPDGTVFDATTLTKVCVVPTPIIEFDWHIFLPVIWKK